MSVCSSSAQEGIPLEGKEHALQQLHLFAEDSFRLMGFGHRVYKNYDPRARVMQRVCYSVLSHLKIKSGSLLLWMTGFHAKDLCSQTIYILLYAEDISISLLTAHPADSIVIFLPDIAMDIKKAERISMSQQRCGVL